MANARKVNACAWAFRHRKTTTLVPDLCPLGTAVPMALDGPINGYRFEVYIEQILVLTLKPGDTAIMDNRSSNKRLTVKLLIEATGAKLVFLSPYSPGLNQIGKAIAKLKANLRRIGERTVAGLCDIIGSLVTMFKPQECHSYFASCNYAARCADILSVCSRTNRCDLRHYPY